MGLVVGWLISTITKYPTNNIIDISFGIIGGFTGAFVANNLLSIPQSSIYTFLSAVCGAFIFIFLVRLRVINN